MGVQIVELLRTQQITAHLDHTLAYLPDHSALLRLDCLQLHQVTPHPARQPERRMKKQGRGRQQVCSPMLRTYSGRRLCEAAA